ncbi:MAG: nuclear transport factor 2 family protein [Pyrinomonadaceae bacterium]
MKRLAINALMIGIVAVALVGAACNRGAGASPTATFTAYYEASKNKDVEGVKKTFSKTTLELFERQAKEQNKTVDEMFKTGMERKPLTGNMPELRNEKINGNDATLEVKDEQSGRWDTLTFVKEDGQWKIALDKMGTQSPGASAN